jgi:transcriptional regulator with XRE-family HTH domain
MVLRNRLNRVLHDRGLAEGEVAMVARLDQGHLNRIKNGRVKPTLVTALRIAYALGTSVNQLFYLEGSERSERHEGQPPFVPSSDVNGLTPQAGTRRVDKLDNTRAVAQRALPLDQRARLP